MSFQSLRAGGQECGHKAFLVLKWGTSAEMVTLVKWQEHRRASPQMCLVTLGTSPELSGSSCEAPYFADLVRSFLQSSVHERLYSAVGM